MQNNSYSLQNYPGIQQSLPNSTAVLVLGILSIVLFCCCYGIIGAILGIIAIVLARKAKYLYQFSPEEYTLASFKNISAGRICAIVGLCLSGIYFVFALIIVAIYGFVFSQILRYIDFSNL